MSDALDIPDSEIVEVDAMVGPYNLRQRKPLKEVYRNATDSDDDVDFGGDVSGKDDIDEDDINTGGDDSSEEEESKRVEMSDDEESSDEDEDEHWGQDVLFKIVPDAEEDGLGTYEDELDDSMDRIGTWRRTS